MKEAKIEVTVTKEAVRQWAKQVGLKVVEAEESAEPQKFLGGEKVRYRSVVTGHLLPREYIVGAKFVTRMVAKGLDSTNGYASTRCDKTLVIDTANGMAFFYHTNRLERV